MRGEKRKKCIKSIDTGIKHEESFPVAFDLSGKDHRVPGPIRPRQHSSPP